MRATIMYVERHIATEDEVEFFWHEYQPVSNPGESFSCSLLHFLC